MVSSMQNVLLSFLHLPRFGTQTTTPVWLILLRQSIYQWIFPTSTGAAWRKQEPIHENSSTFSLIRVVSQKPMPFVLLLTTAVPRTSECPWYSGKKHVLKEFILKSYRYKRLYIQPLTLFIVQPYIDLPTNFLVYCLLKLLIVDNGSHLALAVGRPIWSCYLDFWLTNVNPTSTKPSFDI